MLFKVNHRVNLSWYVEADTREDALQRGENFSVRSILEHGFDEEPSTIREIPDNSPEYSDAIQNITEEWWDGW